MTNSELSKLTEAQLTRIMLDRYDDNAGEIINGFRECGLRGPKLRAAMIRYIERVPAYEQQS